jgi:hypothetical protein
VEVESDDAENKVDVDVEVVDADPIDCGLLVVAEECVANALVKK